MTFEQIVSLHRTLILVNTEPKKRSRVERATQPVDYPRPGRPEPQPRFTRASVFNTFKNASRSAK